MAIWKGGKFNKTVELGTIPMTNKNQEHTNMCSQNLKTCRGFYRKYWCLARELKPYLGL